jgi:hypothetical protein
MTHSLGPMKRLGLGLSFLAAAGALRYAAGSSPSTVERLFSRGVYPAFGQSVGCATALVPFSVAELGALGLMLGLVWWLTRVARRARRDGSWARAIGHFFGALFVVGSAAYLLFLMLWGLNYQRQPFATTAGLDVRPAPVADLRALSLTLVDQANSLRENVSEDDLGVMRVAGDTPGVLSRVETGLRAAAERYPVLSGRCARPKPLLLSKALSWLGLSGIYVPFTGEPNVNVDPPASELPFSAAHEVAHQRGFAREDEANYIAYLACRLHPDPDFRYSGLLSASIYTQNALLPVDRAAFEATEARRSPAVRRDLEALRSWIAEHQGTAMRVSERVNGAYLKAHGQAEGVRSYGRMVDLLLAEQRSPGSMPREGAR